MTKTKRQNQLINLLKKSTSPISATRLAKSLNVSRQIIVGDIALLRASGLNILATHRGYILDPINKGMQTQIAFKHQAQDTLLELETLVKNNCRIIDVIVEHPTYGEIKGNLNIETMDEVNDFIAGDYTLLSDLTQGLHTHTIAYDDPKDLEQALKELKVHNLLYDNSQVS